MKKSIIVLAPGLPKARHAEFEREYKHALLCNPKDPNKKEIINFFYDHKGPDSEFHHPVRGLIIEPSLSTDVKDLTAAYKRLDKSLKPEKTFMFQNGHEILPGCTKVSTVKEIRELMDQD